MKNFSSRRALLFAGALGGAPTLTDAVHARAWVNPLVYPHADDDGNLVIQVYNNMDDSEPIEEVQENIVTHTENQPVWRKTLKENRRRFMVGSSDCNVTIPVTEFLFHADKMVQDGELQLSKSFINIGANDGKTEDPLYSYVEKYQARGILFEKDPELCRRADENLNNTQRIICTGVTPNNLMELLNKHGGEAIQNGQRHFDVIKIDIDSYDAIILKVLLDNHFSAKMFMLEVNPAIPPPYKFATYYHPKLFQAMIDAEMQDWPLRGMSLSYAIDVMNKAGYDFLNFGYHDAIFIKREYRHVYDFMPPSDEFDCYHKAFIMSNGVPLKMTRRWFYEARPEQGVSEIFSHMVTHSLNATQGKIAFPFGLSV